MELERCHHWEIRHYNKRLFISTQVHTRTQLCFLDTDTAAEYERLATELRAKAANIKGEETVLEAVGMHILAPLTHRWLDEIATFRRLPFQKQFLVWKVLYVIDSNMEICSQGSKQQIAIVCSDNGSAPNKPNLYLTQWWPSLLTHKCFTLPSISW